jgi:hypothetical protein
MNRDPKVDALLEDLDPKLAPIAKSLRALVRREAPGLQESVKWGSPFWIGRSNCICLMLFNDHVNLGFLQGATLAKSFPILEGTGKGIRHVKIRSKNDVKNPVLVQLVHGALRLDLEG